MLFWVMMSQMYFNVCPCKTVFLFYFSIWMSSITLSSIILEWSLTYSSTSSNLLLSPVSDFQFSYKLSFRIFMFFPCSVSHCVPSLFSQVRWTSLWPLLWMLHEEDFLSLFLFFWSFVLLFQLERLPLSYLPHFLFVCMYWVSLWSLLFLKE